MKGMIAVLIAAVLLPITADAQEWAGVHLC